MLSVLAQCRTAGGNDCSSNTRRIESEWKMLGWETESWVLGREERKTGRTEDSLKGKKERREGLG